MLAPTCQTERVVIGRLLALLGVWLATGCGGAPATAPVPASTPLTAASAPLVGHGGSSSSSVPTSPDHGAEAEVSEPAPSTLPPLIDPGSSDPGSSEVMRVLLVGDSVAASLATAPGVDRFEVDTDNGVVVVDVRNVGGIACPVIFDGRWWFDDGSTIEADPVCDTPDRYDEVMASFGPDVVLTMFGWPGAGGGQRFSDGGIAVPCEPRFDQAWSAAYRDLVTRLATDAVVVASTPVPIGIAPDLVETRCLASLVEGLPVPVIDTGEWLCPGDDCTATAELRPDAVHFADDLGLRRRAMEQLLAALAELVAG